MNVFFLLIKREEGSYLLDVVAYATNVLLILFFLTRCYVVFKSIFRRVVVDDVVVVGGGVLVSGVEGSLADGVIFSIRQIAILFLLKIIGGLIICYPSICSC